ncbi:glycosyltransferase [Patescibacteria group bacterium]
MGKFIKDDIIRNEGDVEDLMDGIMDKNNNEKQIVNFKKKKVAIVHDFLTQYGGAEKVLESLCEIFPDAPIYTLLYDRGKMHGKFGKKEVRTSFLNNFPEFIKKRKRYLLPFMMTAPEAFDLRDFDLVVSSSGAWSKGIVTRLNTKHIAYLHSPIRFVWDYNEKYLSDIGKKAGFLKRFILNYVRVWDHQASQRPDVLLVNSDYTRRRIEKYYRRTSEIVYPPAFVDDDYVRTEKRKEEKYFLVVSRLSAYKKVDLVVRSFDKLGLPLCVVGEGEQEEYLKKIATKNVKIVGWKNEKILKKYYAHARALIFPTVDDFGLTAVEAMSFGVPVIGIRKGGMKEIIDEGVNGEFFDEQTVEVLSDGIRRFMENEETYNREKIMIGAAKFSKDRFKRNFCAAVDDILKK